MDRYQRQLNLPGFGPEGQRRLSEAAVLVIGAGGLGVPVLQYLCAMGVGRIGIVDGDVLQLSNLQRQVLYTTADIGQPKALLAAARLRQLNPGLDIQSHEQELDPGNALELIGAYDLVVDATDNFSARYLINDACVILRKPWVFGAVHQYEGQISVFNWAGGPTYRCLFPNQPGASEIPDCEQGGVLGVIPGLVGGRQALEVVKLLTGIGRPLSGTVLMLDFLRDTEYRMRLPLNPDNLRITSLADTYAAACDLQHEIGFDMLECLMREQAGVLWDVREPHEFSSGHLQAALSVPLSSLLEDRVPRTDERPLIVYCQRGSRSARAVQHLRYRQPQLQVYSLRGGLDGVPKQDRTL